MAFFDNLLGMYGKYWCPKCLTFISNCRHGQFDRPERHSKRPIRRDPTPRSRPIHRGRPPSRFPELRDPVHQWPPAPVHRPIHRQPPTRHPGSRNPLPPIDEEGWEVFPPELMKPENWGLPPQRHPSPEPSRQPATRPSRDRANSAPPARQTGLVIDDRREPRGGLTDHRAVEVPLLHQPDRSGRIKPKNHNESFLNPSMLRGVKTHPYDPSFPTPPIRRPPRQDLTPEEASAKAFIIMMLNAPWTDIGEDMYALYKEGKVPTKLVKHLKYFLAVVLPYLMGGGEASPADYCKMRAMVDWMAEVGNCFGSPLVWSDGFGKGGGKARESGWWRKEREGFPEGPGLDEAVGSKKHKKKKKSSWF